MREVVQRQDDGPSDRRCAQCGKVLKDWRRAPYHGGAGWRAEHKGCAVTCRPLEYVTKAEGAD
jgi:hypothetical protein